MSKKILIDAVYPDETRVVIYENNLIQELDYETASKKQIKGYIYLAKVTRVEPGLQAAFVEYSSGKHGFLPFSEIHPSYFQTSSKISQDNNVIDEFSFPIPELQRPEILEEDDQDNIIYDDNKEDTENIELDEQIEDVKHDDQEIVNNSDAENHCNIYKDYKIHEVIKRNQIILVQAIKEERGNKGASFTSYISLAGRYCVLMPNSERQGGISRRITSASDRKRIKDIIDKLNISTGSIIVRTAGSRKKTSAIKKDYDYLVRLWNSIREHTLSSSAPSFIHAEGDIIKRTIRDSYDDKVDEILVQGEKSYNLAVDFMKKIIPDNVSKIKNYKSKIPLFCRHQIEEQLASLYNPISYLSSGGYIVINPTEALISIDVNSGRSTSERNVEETAFKTNLEAAEEISRQLRLRDLSGLIVIDFIDMADSKNKRSIEKHLKDCLNIDRAKIQVGSISEFGLLELSRQRLRSSFAESNTIICNHCNGKGIIRSSESNSVMILRTIESEIYKGEFESINIYACADAVMYILNHKRNDISFIEKKYNTKILFHNDQLASSDGFSIERIKRAPVSKMSNISNISVNYEDNVISDDYKRKSSKQKRNWKNEEIIENDIVIDKEIPKIKKNKKQKINKKNTDEQKNLENPIIKIDEKQILLNELDNNIVDEKTDIKDKIEKRKLKYKTRKNRLKKDDKIKSESILKEIWKKIIE